MRLIDTIVSESDDVIHCRKTFSADDFFVQGHFPDFPIVPGVIQCESCLQAGAVLLQKHASGDPDSVPVVTRMDSVKFKTMVRPGDTVDIEVKLKEKLGGAFFLSGKMTCGGKVTARLEFACTIANPSGNSSE